MKKNIFAFIIVASLGFMSCEDFIEHEKRGVQDSMQKSACFQ